MNIFEMGRRQQEIDKEAYCSPNLKAIKYYLSLVRTFGGGGGEGNINVLSGHTTTEISAKIIVV